MKSLIFLFTFFSAYTFAQDFAPFNSDVPKRFFETENPTSNDYYFFAYQTDSWDSFIKYRQYFRRTDVEIPIGPDCSGWGVGAGNAGDTTWLGREIVYNTDAQTLELNNLGGDLLTFDFSIESGDSAMFYSDASNEFYIKNSGSVVEDIYGTGDLVKTFSILHYDLSGEVVPSELHLFEVKLGETLGLISFINCRDFPLVESGLMLMGQLHPTIGKYQMTYDEAFPWDIGDVVQYKSSYNDWESGVSNKTYRLITITDRVETEDSVFIYHSSGSFTVFNPGEEFNPFTANFGYSNPIRFRKGENISEDPSRMMPYVRDFQQTDSTDYCGMREILRIQPDWLVYCDSCQCDIFQDGFGMTLTRKTYTAGLGMSSSSTENYGPMPYPFTTSSIIYSNVGGVECGDQAFAGMGEDALSFELYPNPASNELNIVTKQKAQKLKILDMNGRLILEKEIVNTSIQVDINHLPTGIYVVELISDDARSFARFTKK